MQVDLSLRHALTLTIFNSEALVADLIAQQFMAYLIESEDKSDSTARCYRDALKSLHRAGVDPLDTKAVKAYRVRCAEEGTRGRYAAHLSAAVKAFRRFRSAALEARDLLNRDRFYGYLMHSMGLSTHTAAQYTSEATRFVAWRLGHQDDSITAYASYRPHPGAIRYLVRYAERVRPDLFEALNLAAAYDSLVLGAPLRRLLEVLLHHGWAPGVISELRWGDLFRLPAGWSTPYDPEWYTLMRSRGTLDHTSPFDVITRYAGKWQTIIAGRVADELVQASWDWACPQSPDERLWRSESGQRVHPRAVRRLIRNLEDDERSDTERGV